MKKVILLLLVLVLFVTQDSHAFVSATINAISTSTKAAYDKVHQKIILQNWVVQLKTLKQNYDQSKKYYDDMRKIHEHRGGIPGYFSDRVKNDLSQLNQEEYWRMQNWLESDPEETAYIRKWVQEGDAFIKRKLDFSEKIHNIGKKRDEDLKGLSNIASKEKLSQEELNKYNKQKDILQLEYLSSIDKGIQQLLKKGAEEEAMEWERIRKLKIAGEKERKTIEEIYKEHQKPSQRKDPFQVLEEIPR